MNRLWHALLYSRAGFADTWRTERAFREEIVVAAVAIPLAIYLAESGIELAMMIGSVLLILLTEFLNTAIEAVVDRAGEEISPLAAKAKDAGSAAVLVALLNAALVWIALLIY